MPLETTNVSDFLSGSSEDLLQRFQNPTQPVVNIQPKIEQPQPQNQQQPKPDVYIPKQPSNEPALSSDDILKQFQDKNNPNPEAQADPAVAQPDGPPDPEEENTDEEAETPQEKPKKGGRPPEKVKIPDSFADLVSVLEEKGKLKGWNDGKYETIEDVIELLEANEQEKIQTYEEAARQQWLSSMTPAMQTVYRYSQNLQNPADLIPFLEAMDNVAYSHDLDVENPEDQEAIIRNVFNIQGLPVDSIENDIKDLRDREKLAQRAKELKPVLDRYNHQQVAAMVQQKEQEARQQEAYWKTHQTNVFEKVVKAPTVGGIKLKKQDRDLAYAALAQPDPQLGGLGVYAIIDNLFQKGDFETLTEIVLLGANKKNYRDYIGSTIESKLAESTQRALRASTTTNTVAVDQTKNSNKLERPVQKNWFSQYNK